MVVAIKAGKSEEAHKPAGGWAAYAGLPDRSVRHALSEIRDTGLATRYGDAVILDREGWDWKDEDATLYVRVPHAILSLPADLARAWLALLSLADWRTGAGAATETTIGRRMGRSRCRASVLLDRLGERGLWRRTGKRTWIVAKHRPKSEAFAMVPHFILGTAFGFDFRTRAEVQDEAKNSAGSAEFVSAEVIDFPQPEPSAEVIDIAEKTGKRRTPQPARDEHLAARDEQKAARREHRSRTFIKNLFQEPLQSSRRDAPTTLLPSGLVAGMFGGAA